MDAASLLDLGVLLLRRRRTLLRYALLAGVVTAAIVAFEPKEFTASAAFVPQAGEPSASGVANLAAQFGITVPSTNAAQSPDFYQRILQSRVLLQRIAGDTLSVPELGGKRVAFVDLFELPKGPPERRVEQGALMLGKLLQISVTKTTGVVEISVATEWPTVSLAIVASLVDQVNAFNQQTRRLQASAERAFIEGRLAAAATDQRVAEDTLEGFLKANRNYTDSPAYVFQHDRLQREVALRQQLHTALAQSYEESRIREVRDTPVITVLEPAAVSTLPKARHRLVIVLLALVLGAFAGATVVFTSEMLARLRSEGNAAANELLLIGGDLRAEMMLPIRWVAGRRRAGGAR